MLHTDHSRARSRGAGGRALADGRQAELAEPELPDEPTLPEETPADEPAPEGEPPAEPAPPVEPDGEPEPLPGGEPGPLPDEEPHPLPDDDLPHDVPAEPGCDDPPTIRPDHSADEAPEVVPEIDEP